MREAPDQYAVFITDRGGQRRIGAFPRVASLRWNRVRDDISSAVVQLIDVQGDALDLIRETRTVRNELQIVRNGRTVWEGPITLIEADNQQVTITAKDVLWYATRTRLEQALDYSYPNIGDSITVIGDVLQQWCGDGTVNSDPYNYNVYDYLTPVTGPDDPQTSMAFKAYVQSVWEVLDKFAEDAGVDYTVVGRRIIWWDVQHRAATMRPLTDDDFLGVLTTVEYGSELCVRGTVVNSEGVKRDATADQEWIDYYGMIDKIQASQDTDGDGQADSVVISSAARMVSQGIPAPVRVRVPENVPLSLDTDLTFDDLIPGTWAQITAAQTARPMSAWHKLDKVSVSFNGGVEQVAVSFIPGTATVVTS